MKDRQNAFITSAPSNSRTFATLRISIVHFRQPGVLTNTTAGASESRLSVVAGAGAVRLRQRFLNFFPLPQGQRSFRPTLVSPIRGCCFAAARDSTLINRPG